MTDRPLGRRATLRVGYALGSTVMGLRIAKRLMEEGQYGDLISVLIEWALQQNRHARRELDHLTGNDWERS